MCDDQLLADKTVGNIRPAHLNWAYLALLGALVVACNGSKPENFGGPQGGLYPIANAKVLNDKIAEFDSLPTQWQSSTATVLHKNTLGESIESNKVSNVPEADKYQRYNYVVQELRGKNEILVATWSFAGKRPGDKVDFDSVCGPGGAVLYRAASVEFGKMVNFWPEDNGYPYLVRPRPTPSANACTSDSGVSSNPKFVGVLDAHSKHFMLAQGSGTTLGGYKQSQTTWTRMLVKYAGEIIVDVKACTYFINQGSGTYQPLAGRRYYYLERVAELFKDKIGVGPTHVWESRWGTSPFNNSSATIPGCKP